MSLIVADRIKETTTTAGATDFTLAGAMTAFKPFSAVMAVGDTAYYATQAVDASGNATGDWEVGLGTFGANNLLARTTVYASSNAGAKVNFAAGTKQVWIDITAQQFSTLNTPPYDITLFYPGSPGASAFVTRTPVARSVTFPANFVGSVAAARVGAAAQTDFTIQRITSGGATSTLGTLRFAAGSGVGSFIAASSVSLAAGDLFVVTAPATADLTLADIGIVFSGVRT